MISALHAMQEFALKEQHFIQTEFLNWRHGKESSYFFEVFFELNHTLPIVLLFKRSSSFASHEINSISRSKVLVHMQIRGDNGASAALPRMTMHQYLATCLDGEVDELYSLQEHAYIRIGEVLPKNIEEVHVVYS